LSWKNFIKTSNAIPEDENGFWHKWVSQLPPDQPQINSKTNHVFNFQHLNELWIIFWHMKKKNNSDISVMEREERKTFCSFCWKVCQFWGIGFWSDQNSIILFLSEKSLWERLHVHGIQGSYGPGSSCIWESHMKAS